MPMTESKAFKDYFDATMVGGIADAMKAAHGPFDASAFIDQVLARLEGAELKERVAIIAEALADHLPDDYPEALAIVLTTLGDDLPVGNGMFDQGWAVMPLAHFVEVYGLEHFERSIEALHLITRKFTAEFAIRPYLLRYPARTLQILHGWAEDPNPHVRRLVSEGTRPRLPWGIRLRPFIEDPREGLALLEKLKDDPSEYVRRSVANHLNDVSKDHPALVVDICRQWLDGASSERRWIVRHGLRTLIKNGDPAALSLLGFDRPNIGLRDLKVTPAHLSIGQELTLSFTLENLDDTPRNLAIDYIVHFVKANGRTSPKVFKLTTRTLAPGQTTHIEKRHSLRPVTTRRYYAGEHRIAVQVNGAVVGEGAFVLE
jgi:3-methyladenine DNA glycosylase AlkC